MNEIQPIHAGFATTGQGAGPLIVTQRAGLFTKYGLEVEVRLMGGAKGVVRGLMEGEIQFGNLAAPALLRAVLGDGADLVFLTGGINQQFLVGRPGFEDRKELTGKRIAFVGDGGLNDVLVLFALDRLEKEGITGVRLIPVSSGGRQCVAMLLSKECDAGILTPPEAIEARRLGCRFLVDFAEYGLNYALGGIASKRSYIQENEQITKYFVRAYVEGMARYRNDREFTVEVQREYSGIADKTIAEETYDITQPGMPRTPYPVLKALEIALQVMSKDLPEARTAGPSQFVEDRFIRDLEKNDSVSPLYNG